jgi:hypothetical protein
MQIVRQPRSNESEAMTDILRYLLSALLVGLLSLVAAPISAQSGEPPIDIKTAPVVLLMIGDPGCPYCARFEREVAPGYTASDDGKLAPLVRRFRTDADVAFLRRIVYSPTFVMLVRGKEVGRIVGYAGPDLFWMQVAGLLTNARVALDRESSAPTDSGAKPL